MAKTPRPATLREVVRTLALGVRMPVVLMHQSWKASSCSLGESLSLLTSSSFVEARSTSSSTVLVLYVADEAAVVDDERTARNGEGRWCGAALTPTSQARRRMRIIGGRG